MTKKEAQDEAIKFAKNAALVQTDTGVYEVGCALTSIAYGLIALSGGTTAEHKEAVL